MLTQSLHKRLNDLFAHLESSTNHMSLNEFEGFMYALTITPDIIQLNEWLPKIYNDQTPEYVSVEQAKSSMGVLMDCYNHYNELRNEGKLIYDYDIKQLNDKKFDGIIEWDWGFLMGLRLRMPIWTSGIVAKELSIDEDPVANSLAVIEALVDAEFDTTHLIKKIKDKYSDDISEEELQQHLIGFLLTVLPEAVKVLQEFGRHMDERRKGELVHNQQARSNKIGRNEPCPCGSGKKYKKCCALTDQNGHLH